MARKCGGQYKHWAEEARVWAWYHEIRRRCDWSDYRLDNEFAWTTEGKASFSSADRPRTFEWIRKTARKPAGRDKRWRGMSELVAAVEQHPLFEGTMALYEMKLWSLLQENTVTPKLLESRIDRLLEDNGLIRAPFEKISERPNALISEFGYASLFDRCLMLSLSTMDRLSKIELVWSLYQQSESSHNWEFRSIIESVADNLLDHFFFDYLPEHHLRFYPSAIECLQETRLTRSPTFDMGYFCLEVVGAWPILPKQLVGKIEENHLFG